MDYVALKAHIDTDADARGYAGMDEYQVAADMAREDRDTRVKASMPGHEILKETNAAELEALTSVDKTAWLSLCGIPQVDPSNTGPMVAVAQGIFPGGVASATAINLVAKRMEPVSDSVRYGFGRVHAGDVQNARAIA